MGMVVRTNMGALKSTRNLNKNSKSSNSALEKLASGYQINRAADDASGLAISEKMQAQITALGVADDNCEDGISLLQTAEGYMAEMQDMLNRMVELSEKSANGVLEYSGNTGYSAYGVSGGQQNAGTDRAALQAEMDQLCAELDRIAMTANFNGNKLFYMQHQAEFDEYNNLAHVNTEFKLNRNVTLQIGETAHRGDKLVANFDLMTTDALFARSGKMDFVTLSSADGSRDIYTSLLIANGGQTLTVDGGAQPFKGKISANPSGLTINISDQAYASKAAEVIRDVLDDVSIRRSNIGALEQRLEHTINYTENAEENLSASNSRIKDADMAEQMAKYTQENVLMQAAQSMLAHANSEPQNILSLLQ